MRAAGIDTAPILDKHWAVALIVVAHYEVTRGQAGSGEQQGLGDSGNGGRVVWRYVNEVERLAAAITVATGYVGILAFYLSCVRAAQPL